jgi:endogenous inhibitor of DNA gyrase (YacG/DUF329 family)
MPSNARTALYNVNCPHCGNDFVWDTDINADGGDGQSLTQSVPLNGASAPASPPAQSGTEQTPAAEAAQTVCPNCGKQVNYDTETVQTGTDQTTGEEGYLLTCPGCNTQFLEPLPAPAPTAIPAGASAEQQAMFRAGILAERNRLLALDEMSQAAPAMAKTILAAKRSGASADAMRQNLIKGMAAGRVGLSPAASFASALGNDVRTSGVNSLINPQHAGAPKSLKDSAYEKAIADYNKQRGGINNA